MGLADIESPTAGIVRDRLARVVQKRPLELPEQLRTNPDKDKNDVRSGPEL